MTTVPPDASGIAPLVQAGAPLPTAFAVAAGLVVLNMALVYATPRFDPSGLSFHSVFLLAGQCAVWLALGIMLAQARPPALAMAAPLIAIICLIAGGYAAIQQESGLNWLGAVLVALPLAALALFWLSWSPGAVRTGGAFVVGVFGLLLVMTPFARAEIEQVVDPGRAERQARQREEALMAQEAADAAAAQQDADRFARLGPDSSLEDFLYFLGRGEHEDEVYARMRGAPRVQQEVAGLIETAGLMGIGDLHRYGLTMTPELCAAYGKALRASVDAHHAALRASEAVSSEYAPPFDEVDNIVWFAANGCPLTETRRALTAYAREPVLGAMGQAFLDSPAALAE